METWQRGEYEVSTEQSRLDLHVIRDFLASSYWAPGIPLDVVKEACRNSLCFGLYACPSPVATEQIGFARVITDYASFGYLADVFVLEEHRGAGLSKWMMSCLMEHKALQGLRRLMLATRDAHGLYERYGFRALGSPAKFMEIARPGLYLER